ncbi:MAG: hypothetical protein UR90_C0022G0003 [Parcubacteria group bacterium GW2011_GWC1_35_8]|uniref:ATP-grasp domain-containing protein n=2 Tax=Candidatus Nomuraibacteriota TaxID=1752729 RepID=A0A1F6YWB6_9BACT|nr:MAG: hypothetical protein UR90_C0022G0003 [Parcubacteria group bacterium GW2011_GWC1_35_8]KKP87785.1 MAG: hypothetical protein UR91_C0036G0006 [Candidatus Nomurabacteria bacterium GW2011_GWC2_35_8]OGJ05153.1 MAG: hypothetical protein A2238_01305 [Candidatus Nomurabacteria bacterium RIFOXYA2_FULL_35_9]OGJ10646.1 MAG: hypothetical protein A2456_01480 [Candidatus Nomurabacteria bacterium RIFOXYC2_FULL_36_19]OGJ14684.1 MAG: hypothetical protein A2554_01585 [Candidatus Nomurabacteria bacterium RI
MLTLSEYFPKNTEYFYSYPIGDTLHFYNAGDPINEELISARLLACVGEDIKVIIYDSTLKDGSLDLLRKYSDIPFVKENQIIVLPKNINEEVLGLERNELITKALLNKTSSGNLIMAQPILDNRLIKDYQIDPNLSIWLNDKKNLDQYVSSELLPERYVQFINGQELFKSKVKIPLPCVVKISASSSGEGIRICKNIKDLKQTKIDFKERTGTIFIEKFITYVHNIGFQFGIPYGKPIFFPSHIIGYNHQITAIDGEFLGGFIFQNEWDEKLEQIKKIIEIEILPKIQAMGWYGVGGFDVLINKEGEFFIIDSNFRTTGMTAYIFLTRHNLIPKSMVSFTATFKGSEDEFIKKILSLNKGKNKILTIISLTKKDDEYRFNAALLFEKKGELPSLANKLIEIGVKSEVLEMLEKGIK